MPLPPIACGPSTSVAAPAIGGIEIGCELPAKIDGGGAGAAATPPSIVPMGFGV